ncbi:MAG: hypothetical protein QW372_01745 [Nitrososphaerales archaeon]
MASELGSLEGSWNEPKQLNRLVRRPMNRAERLIYLKMIKKNKNYLKNFINEKKID